MPTRKTSKAPIKKSAHAKWIGVGLIVLSFLLYGGLLALPFRPISLRSKLVLSSLLVIGGEATFWVGSIVVGKEVITRYKRYFNPRSWLCCQPPDANSKQR
jgi:hypothetical protein